MRPVEFVGQTILLAPPAGWDQARDGECGVLPVRVEQIARIATCVSYWKPSPADLARLANGGHIRLSVIVGQPPGCLSVDKVEELP